VPADAPTAFFSYSREDSEFALRLAGDLKAAGANVWLDQLDIQPGQRWARAVEEALNNSPRVLVILSSASVSSTHVEDEVNFALEEHKTVMPILYRDCKVPFQLRPFQYVDFRTDYAQGLKLLLKTLGVSQRVAAASPTENPEANLAELHSSRFKDLSTPEKSDTDLKSSFEAILLGQGIKMDDAPTAGAKWNLGLAPAPAPDSPEGLCAKGDQHFGYGIAPRSEIKKAFECYQQAAEAGSALGMRKLAFMYQRGLGVTKDCHKAVHWYGKAIAMGDAIAMHGLGMLYYDGDFGTKDYKQAVRWFSRAAEAGNRGGMEQLAFCYEHGQGVEVDRQQAVSWYRKAAELRSDFARQRLRGLEQSAL